ncbi:MAG TPA: hypothetical protein VHG72_13420, partial [Polyangia bacterium]|nr:hypothetical protein [Polyangia bacterium]
SSASSSVTFSIEDHRILIASARSQQEALSPQVFSINFDPLPAIRSALSLGPPSPNAAQTEQKRRDRRGGGRRTAAHRAIATAVDDVPADVGGVLRQ